VRAKTFLTVPNLLSLSRFPLAAAFAFAEGTPTRLALIGMVSATDLLDGWMARRGGRATWIGALLDPVADKTFVLVALSVFLLNGVLATRDYFLLLSRDLATAVGFLVAYKLPGLDPARFKARMPGKILTVLQLLAILLLVTSPGAMRWLIPVVVAVSVVAIADYTLMLHRTRYQQE
jgi:phosphatidylglycerophosphate synthase